MIWWRRGATWGGQSLCASLYRAALKGEHPSNLGHCSELEDTIARVRPSTIIGPENYAALRVWLGYELRA